MVCYLFGFTMLQQNKRSELIEDWRLLAFGTLASLASAPGQTLVISLFNNDIRAAFDLTHGDFGQLYMFGTLASAALILWTGKLIDQFDLRLVFAITTIGLALACFVAGSATGPFSLLIALFLLRQFGQGLMSHISVTSVNRYYETVRGKASAIVGQGFSFAEAVLPLSISTLILIVGWRNSWFVLAAVSVGLILPLLLLLIADHKKRHGRYLDRLAILDEASTGKSSDAQRQWTRGEMLRDPVFYGVFMVVFVPSFFNTGLMFHHQHIVAAKEWSLETWYIFLMLYAGSAVVFSLISGQLVDRLGAKKLMPFFTLPIALGGLALFLGESSTWIGIVLVAFGAAAGMNGTVVSPFWAEMYGVKHLGSIKSLAAAVMIFASALSPPAYGILFDANVSVATIGLGNVAFVVVASLLAWFSLRSRR